MTTIQDLAQYTAGKLGITPEAAEGALATYLHQLEALDERSIDPDNLSQDDAGSIEDAVRSAQKSGDLGEQELASLEEAVARRDIAVDDLATAQQLRDNAIRAALDAGARVEDVMQVTGLSREQLYQIDMA